MKKSLVTSSAALSIAAFVALACWLYPLTCGARVYIDINSPSLRRIPLAIPLFATLTPGSANKDLPARFSDIISDTLNFTGFFKILDRKGFLVDPKQAGLNEESIQFKSWTTAGAELLIQGGYSYDGDRLKMELRLFDTFSGRMIVGKRYTGHFDDHRRMLRRFANDVIERLTGREGIFTTRIAFISNTTGTKEIYISDFDGQNPEPFTSTGAITLFPAWSSDGRYLAYTAYKTGKPDLYIRSIRDKRGSVVSTGGSSITPAWAPGQFVFAASLSHQGNPCIYLISGDGKILEKLTNHWGIDVAPAWSPDGKAFAFVSDRTGTPQIHIKRLNSSEVKRLTYKGEYNSSPCWSPRGDSIVYTGFSKTEGTNIFVIDLKEGSNPIQLTRNSGDNESPSWSPDGTMIAFSSTREGPSKIYVMNADGSNQRRLLTLKGEQTDPSWSPRLPDN